MAGAKTKTSTAQFQLRKNGILRIISPIEITIVKAAKEIAVAITDNIVHPITLALKIDFKLSGVKINV